jgi:lysyl-tRNA synthetase class II
LMWMLQWVKGNWLMRFFGAKCEGNYIQPTFITDYPKECHPCVKQQRQSRIDRTFWIDGLW